MVRRHSARGTGQAKSLGITARSTVCVSPCRVRLENDLLTALGDWLHSENVRIEYH